MVHRRSMLAGSVAFAALAAGRDLRAQTGQSPLGQSPLGQSQALAPAAKPPSFRLEEAAHFAHQVTGVAVSADGRLFGNFPRWPGDSPISGSEVGPDRTLKPDPDHK